MIYAQYLSVYNKDKILFVRIWQLENYVSFLYLTP